MSIKIVIAGRTYPLTIERSQEEEIRNAAKYIEQTIKKLQESYAVKDHQDLLAMASLQVAVELLNQGKAKENKPYLQELKKLNQLVLQQLTTD